MEPDEVVRTLNSLEKKHQTTAVTIVPTKTEDDLNSIPLPEPPEWPVLDQKALHGILGDIVTTIEPETEADPVGILVSTLVVFGNAIGRDAYYPIEGSQHAGNLFSVMVGDSSRGRKGTSLGRTLSLFDAADPDWRTDCITNGLSSGEGLIWAVRDPTEVTEPVKDKSTITGYQTVVKDPGADDKRLLVLEPEFAQTLKVLKREGNTLSPVIRQAWDGGNLTVMTKNNSSKASDTHISILGHITRPELAKTLGDTDCFNGFANRILWCLVRRHKLLPDGGNGLEIDPLREKITQAVARARTIGVMKRTPQARELWHQLYPELTAEKPGLYGAVVGRGEAQTLRLSMLYALLDGSTVIDVCHLEAATAVWRYSETSARIIFNSDDATADPLEQLLLQKIKQDPGINRRGLHRAIGGHVPGKDMVKALASLRDQNQVRCEKVQTGGRPSECWHVQEPVQTAPVAIQVPPAAESNTDVPANAGTSTVQPPEQDQPETTTTTMSMSELFNAVTAISGKIKRKGDRLIIDAAPEAITRDMTLALKEHQPMLLTVLPDSDGVPAELLAEFMDEPDNRAKQAQQLLDELNQTPV